MINNPEDTLLAYVKAFESLDPENLLPFYNLPCLLIAPMGVALLSDRDAALGIASALIEHARSQDYRRSEVRDLNVKRLADNVATLAGVFLRFDSCEREIGRFGFAYTMYHAGSSWKIAVGVAHDPFPEQS